MSVNELTFSADSDEVGQSEVTLEAKDSDVTTGKVWVNTLKDPINLPIICRVPQKVLIMMRSVERLMINDPGMGTQEFGVFLSGSFTSAGHLVLTEDFYIPSQKVSTATIDFTEEPPDMKKYNGVIHRHPAGCKNFSGTDTQNINKNFEFSLLYEGNEIITGIWNLEFGEQRIQLPLKIEIMYPIYGLDKDIISKIKKDVPSQQLLPQYTNPHYGFGGSVKHNNDNPKFDFMDRKDIRGGFGPGLSNLERAAFSLDHDSDDFVPFEDTSKPEENLGVLHICKYCGDVIRVAALPHTCESCNAVLMANDEAILVSNISQYDEDTRQKILDKLEEEKDEKEEEVAELEEVADLQEEISNLQKELVEKKRLLKIN